MKEPNLPALAKDPDRVLARRDEYEREAELYGGGCAEVLGCIQLVMLLAAMTGGLWFLLRALG